jgi:hypothetical protein
MGWLRNSGSWLRRKKRAKPVAVPVTDVDEVKTLEAFRSILSMFSTMSENLADMKRSSDETLRLLREERKAKNKKGRPI